jgi:gamma-glutamylcyclotransferase (GGCT)/AIG2-like uncharacterized protein YtfP
MLFSLDILEDIMTTPKVTASQSPIMNGEHRLRSENLAFDIDVWYPPLAAHTFASVFLPLTRLEAQAIVAYYNASWRHIPDGMNASVVETLLTLEARIDEALKQFHEKGAFLRLCGRSPKDGEPTDPELRTQIWTNYQRTLRTMKGEEDENEDDGNLRVAAIARTESWLRVRSGADAMPLLLTSERVFSDMIDWLHFGEPEQVVLREFSDAFDLSTEFRCYIQNGQLLGMSQYDTYAKHSFLQVLENRVTIIHAVISEWRNVRDCIETIDGSYCADFGVDMKAGTAQLIEISPFRNCTGPALFAWKGKANLFVPDRVDVHDDNLQTHMCSVFPQDGTVSEQAVFRVRSEVIPGISALVEMNWDLRWSKETVDTPKPYRQIYAQVAPGLVDKTMHILKKIHRQLSNGVTKQHILFVYGTLKRNCHWHSKYMIGTQFMGEATTLQPQSLVIGECGVPYLLNLTQGDENAVPVRGELWRLSEEMLQNIDEYEGIQKGHYSREVIDVAAELGCGTAIYKAFCYFYAIKPGQSDVDAGLLGATRISEYPAEEQKKRYKPIHHIQVKQLQYLGEEATT